MEVNSETKQAFGRQDSKFGRQSSKLEKSGSINVTYVLGQ